jgi:hypothetical protein
MRGRAGPVPVIKGGVSVVWLPTNPLKSLDRAGWRVGSWRCRR